MSCCDPQLVVVANVMLKRCSGELSHALNVARTPEYPPMSLRYAAFSPHHAPVYPTCHSYVALLIPQGVWPSSLHAIIFRTLSAAALLSFRLT
jgi:hypothetical protein